MIVVRDLRIQYLSTNYDEVMGEAGHRMLMEMVKSQRNSSNESQSIIYYGEWRMYVIASPSNLPLESYFLIFIN